MKRSDNLQCQIMVCTTDEKLNMLIVSFHLVEIFGSFRYGFEIQTDKDLISQHVGGGKSTSVAHASGRGGVAFHVDGPYHVAFWWLMSFFNELLNSALETNGDTRSNRDHA